MKFLKEIISQRNQYEDPEDEDEDELEFDFNDEDPEDENEDDDELEFDFNDEDQGEEQDPDSEFNDEDQGEEQDPNIDDDQEDEFEMDQVASTATDNADRQGIICPVRNAHLVYKRKTEEGTYEELWIFGSHDTVVDNLKIRKAILAGTDIPPTNTQSPDGKQQYTIWAAGNAEMLNIKGLPN